ncbi:hypothetical protein B0H14DRAFT_2734120 [Mycena olivaceomarginata]|nr:hypothetical protein B0H14DRAFT_2734120 [Mycena olivaceomarginata]
MPLFELVTERRLPLPGVTLLLCTLGTKRAGISMDRNDLVRVETAMDILKFAAPRLQSVGRLRELLRDLRSLDGGTPESSPEPSLPSPSRVYHSEQCNDLWGGTSSPDQPELKPGMSIEQLLASVGEPSHTIETILDDQLMSMWMGGPVA